MLLNRGFFNNDLVLRQRELIPRENNSFEGLGLVCKSESVPYFINGIYDSRRDLFVSIHLPTLWKHIQDSRPKEKLKIPEISNCVYLDLISIFSLTIFFYLDPASEKLVRNSRSNQLTGGRLTISPEMHLIYASTWFTLSGCIAAIAFFRFRKGVL